MPDRVGRGGLGDERDLIAEVGRHPGGGLAALLGPDAADDKLGDAALGEQLLQAGRGERVMRGLGQDGLPVARRQRLDQADVAAGRVKRAAGARFGVQDPHDEVAAGPDAVDQAGDVVGDVRVGDGLPERALAERFLDVDDDESASHVFKHRCPPTVAKGRIRSRCGPIRSRGGRCSADLPARLN
jgi:hypothetical protein